MNLSLQLTILMCLFISNLSLNSRGLASTNIAAAADNLACEMGESKYSYFTGALLSMSEEGKIEKSSSFLLKSEFDTAERTVNDELYTFSKGDSERSQACEANTYDVDSSLNLESRSERRLKFIEKSTDVEHVILELRANNLIYREERISPDAAGRRGLNFFSGRQISASEFQTKLDELNAAKQTVRGPASRGPASRGSASDHGCPVR